MLSRVVMIAGLLGATTAVSLEAQKTYGANFGVTAPLVATGTQVSATYFGWEATTYYGHEIYALTGADYATDLTDGCFAFYSTYRGNCQGNSNVDLGGLLGLPLFGKPFGPTCPNGSANPCLAATQTVSFGWTPGTEIIFALQVVQSPTEFNWFFSGDPLRNNDALSHLAYFPPSTWPNGVPGDEGNSFVPGTAGVSIFGFEDVTYQDSDWDFDNALFSVDGKVFGTPNDVTPEPATLALIATGLASLGAGRARRRRPRPPVA